jgi:hypothetical protein
MSAVLERRVIRLGSAGQPTSSKYRNKPTEVDGLRFDSKKEATRWKQLRLLEANGEVRNIQRQVTYPLTVEGKLVCKYKADFVYEELRKGVWLSVTEDVKGQTNGGPMRIFRLKAKLMQAIHGIEIRVT